MRGGHTKQKVGPKRVENVPSNDGPSSTTRRSKAGARVSKDESEKVEPKHEEGGVGRRRRVSSRSKSGGDNSVDREKVEAPKTRSSDGAGSSGTQPPRLGNRRTITTPRKLGADKLKPVRKKDSDKNVETPVKRKTPRRDPLVDEKPAVPKSQVPLSSNDKGKEKRNLRVPGRTPRSATGGSREKVSSEQPNDEKDSSASDTAKSNLDAVKGNDRPNSSVEETNNSVSKKNSKVSSDSETESEKELSGEYVYVDTDDSDTKASKTEVSECDKTSLTKDEADLPDTNTLTDAVVCENVESSAANKVGSEQTEPVFQVGERDSENSVPCQSLGGEDVEHAADDSSIAIDSGDAASCHNKAESESNKVASVNTEHSTESEVPSTDLELHLEDSFEQESSETSENGISERIAESLSSTAVPENDSNLAKLSDDTAQLGLTTEHKVPTAEIGEGSRDSGCLQIHLSDTKPTEEKDASASTDRFCSQDTASTKDENPLWMDDHALDVGDHCLDEARDDVKSREMLHVGVDLDSCSTASTSNDVLHSPGSQQGRSKHRGSVRPGMDFTQGSRLEACDFMGKWYPAKIIDVDWKEQEVLIHFERWSSRFDEWVSMESPRLRAITRTSARKEFRQKLQEVFKIEETVLARWVDGKMYPAKIAAFNPNGSFQVVFHDDGIQKTVKYTNITKLKDDQALQLSIEKVSAPLIVEKKKSLDAAPSRSSSREKKPSKRTLSPDDALSPTAKSSPTKMPKKAEKVPDMLEQKQQKRIQKSEKRPSTSGVSVRRKKLIVGGIFQAKRPQNESESPKKSSANQRPLSVSSKSKSVKRPRFEVEGEASLNDSEAKVEPTESTEVLLKTTESCMPDEEIDADGQIQKKKFAGGHAPKEFIIEEDHNHFKCPIDDCGKGFRKETLLASHMKHYHKTDSKAYGRRRNESEGSRGESANIKPSTPTVTSTESAMASSEKSEAEKRTVRGKLPEAQKKVETSTDLFADFTKEIKEKEVKKIRAKSESIPTKPRETSKKGIPGSRQKSDDGKQAGPQRRRTVGDANKGEKKKMEPKAKAGPSHSLKEEDKESAKSRNVGVKDKIKRRRVAGGNVKGVEKKPVPEPTEDECSFKMMSLDDENVTPPNDLSPSLSQVTNSPRGYEPPTGGTQNVRRTGKKRKLLMAAAATTQQQPKEELASSVGDYGSLRSPTDLAEFPPYEDDDDGGREEVVNCICRIREEDGLMMQCENCMAWQHGACFNIEDEEKVPNKYICFACQSPRGQRESYRYWYDQDWWKLGEMSCFNFLSKDHHKNAQSLSGSMYKTHTLASSVYSVNNVLRSLRVKLEIAKNLDHPDLQLWSQPWTDGTQSGSNPTAARAAVGGTKQKGELSYCDHSYSVPSRNVSGKKEVPTSVQLAKLPNAAEVASGMPSEIQPINNGGVSEIAGNESVSSANCSAKTHAQPDNLPVSQNKTGVMVAEKESATQAVNSQDPPEQSVGSSSDHLEVSESVVESSLTTPSQIDSVEAVVRPLDTESKSDIPQQKDYKTSPLKDGADPQLASAVVSGSLPATKSEEIVVKDEDREECSNQDVPSTIEEVERKNIPVDSPVKLEPSSPAVHSAEPASLTTGENGDLISCQLNLLDHIEQMQEELDRRLEEISQHVESFEMECDIPAAASHRETLADLPSTKRLVRLMQFNLSKVQRMAALQ